MSLTATPPVEKMKGEILFLWTPQLRTAGGREGFVGQPKIFSKLKITTNNIFCRHGQICVADPPLYWQTPPIGSCLDTLPRPTQRCPALCGRSPTPPWPPSAWRRRRTCTACGGRRWRCGRARPARELALWEGGDGSGSGFPRGRLGVSYCSALLGVCLSYWLENASEQLTFAATVLGRRR